MLPMHNSMKKIIFSLAFAFFSLSAFALNWEDFSLSVEPLFGLKAGQVDEFVFLKDSQASSDTLSELNWEIKPELYYGLKIRGTWKDFFEESYITAGIPLKTGVMTDSDWLNIETEGLPSSVYSYKTCFSEHDNELAYDIQFGFKGGYDFSVLPWLHILPAIAFDYANFKFNGKNGSGLYGYGSDGAAFFKENGYYASYDDAENQYVVDFSGYDVISYQRVIYYFWLGTDVSFVLPYHFAVDAGFFFTPYVYAVSYDSHKYGSKKVDYADLTYDFFSAFKGSLGVTYAISERHSVSLTAGYFYLRTMRGNDYSKLSTSKTYSLDESVEGGAGAHYFDVTLSYRFKIF